MYEKYSKLYKENKKIEKEQGLDLGPGIEELSTMSPE